MMGNEIKQKLPLIELRPYQTELIDTYFSPDSKKCILLGADVGLGKTAALCALSWKVLKEQSTARILLLAPAALQAQFAAMFNKYGVPAQIVDRYRFREMLDSSVTESFWPSGNVTILSSDFAKKPDILDALSQCCWDLVLVEESHTFGGARAELLRHVGEHAVRMLFSTLPNIEPPIQISPEDISVVQWKLKQLGESFITPPVLHEIEYSFSTSELELLETVDSLIFAIGDDEPQHVFLKKSLLRNIRSSQSAFENTVRRLKENLIGNDFGRDVDELPIDESANENKQRVFDSGEVEKLMVAVDSALDELDKISSDSKLDAFGTLLSGFSTQRESKQKICVITDFLSTLHYLSVEVESRGMEYHLLHGGLGFEERQNALDHFNNAGDVLIATMMLIKGIDLRFVTDLVLYDIPASKVALQVVISRFIGSNGLNIHVLSPTNGGNYFDSEPLVLLKELIAEMC